MLSKYLCALLILWSECASAMVPESGFWWNPSESGSGFVLEIQNNVLAIGVYLYEPSGVPLWLVSAGTMVNDNQFTGTLSKSTGGQCITCAYRPATSAPAGTVQILFDSPSTATLTLNGTRVTRVQRFAFGVNEANPYKLLGEWSLVTGTASVPIYFAERVGFSTTGSSSAGIYAGGARTGSTSNVAVGTKNSDGNWSILLDSSSSYYTMYTFSFSGINTMEGQSWTFLKSQYPSGTGLPFIAFRSGSAMSVANGTGPALQKSADLSIVDNYDKVDASRAQFSATPAYQPDEMRAAERARQIFQEMTRP